MRKYLLTFLVVFVVAIMATNISVFATVKKPAEADALVLFKYGWAFAAKKKFFTVTNVKKTDGQTLTIFGVQLYKMDVDVTLQSIWGVVVCQRSGLFDDSITSLHMMRRGEYEKLSDNEKSNFMGKGLGSMDSCWKVEKFGEREKIVLKRILKYEKSESGWKLTNENEVLRLNLHEKYLVGEEADAEIKRMDGVQGSVARSLTQKGRFLHMKIKRSGVMLREEVLFEGKAVVGDAVMLLGKGDEVDIYEHEYDHSKPEDAYVRVKTKDSKAGWVQYKDVE